MSPKLPAITNLAAYQFAPLDGLAELRQRLLAQCRASGLKGTILLSAEGVNLFVAGGKAEIDALVTELRVIPGLASLAPKYSESEAQPFSRMLVRIKKEIIAFGVDGIEPGRRTSPKLKPAELKQWLDEGRAVTLLDTRNDYEVKLGTFRGAKVLNIDHFREFPNAVASLPPEMKETPIVMFCTGGIRCEKAGPYMEREGFQQIFQLDGGILKYFEDVGDAHYDGECFVFDHRVGVDPALGETESAICFVCQNTLGPEEQLDSRYVSEVSCPQCYRSEEEKRAADIAFHQTALDHLAGHPPGSRPWFEERPFRVPQEFEGGILLEVMDRVFPDESWSSLINRGSLLTADRLPVVPEQIVHAGERYLRLIEHVAEPDVNPRLQILHEDDACVVVVKGSPLPCLPDAIYRRNTLQFILSQAYAPQKLQPTHLLTAEDTGLVVCARTRHFAKLFAQSPPEITWLLRVKGFSGNDLLQVVQQFSDGSHLLEVKSRGSQEIREMLQQLEPRISPGTSLHAWKAVFTHPLTRQPLSFETPFPAWAADGFSQLLPELSP